MSEMELLRARVRRLDRDLLAYGRHLETCEAAGRRWREQYKDSRISHAFRCVCGFHEAIRFATNGRWPARAALHQEGERRGG
jgi:hypothetical protein